MISAVPKKPTFTHYPGASEEAIRLQQARLKLKLSQGSFAARAGLHREHYLKLERSHGPIGGQQETWVKIARGHGITTDRLREFIAGEIAVEQLHAPEQQRAQNNEKLVADLRNGLLELGVDPALADAASGIGVQGKKMKALPEEVRRAVLGVVHVLLYPLEEAIPAARSAVAKYAKAPKASPEEWFLRIRIVLDSKPKSGTLRAASLDRVGESLALK